MAARREWRELLAPRSLAAACQHAMTRACFSSSHRAPPPHVAPVLLTRARRCCCFFYRSRSLQLVRAAGCKSGLVFNPSTSLDICKYVMDKIDIILLMSVNPGFGGQSFIPATLDKAKEVRRARPAATAPYPTAPTGNPCQATHQHRKARVGLLWHPVRIGRAAGVTRRPMCHDSMP